MHLTCTNMPVESLETALEKVRTRRALCGCSIGSYMCGGCVPRVRCWAGCTHP